MKALNLGYYSVNTSAEVKSELDKITGMTTDEICKEYVLDPEDVEKFVDMMEEDYETLLEEEERVEGTDDWEEEYAQLYNFL